MAFLTGNVQRRGAEFIRRRLVHVGPASDQRHDVVGVFAWDRGGLLGAVTIATIFHATPDGYLRDNSCAQLWHQLALGRAC